MVDIVVRDAQQADHPTLQRIFRSASLSNPDDVPALVAHPEVLRLDDQLISRGRTRVAALADGTIIGFATTSTNALADVELEDLFVDPAWRRRGAARRLVHHIASEAEFEQVGQILVVANLHAMEFYLAAGFEADGPASTQLGGGVRMHLDIPAARPRPGPAIAG